jgi:hypothetical protein
MSWMGELHIMIQEAAEYGVTLEVGDFRRLDNRLMINGVDADDWFRAMASGYDRLEDREW